MVTLHLRHFTTSHADDAALPLVASWTQGLRLDPVLVCRFERLRLHTRVGRHFPSHDGGLVTTCLGKD